MTGRGNSVSAVNKLSWKEKSRVKAAGVAELERRFYGGVFIWPCV
jgi:hypothetical protein